MGSFINAKELEHFLKIPESTIYELSANGEIPAYGIGESWAWDLTRIEKFMDKEKIRDFAETLISRLKLKKRESANG